MSKVLLNFRQTIIVFIYFFEKDKSLYYNNLTRIRAQHDIGQWIKYFLIGIEQTSNQAIETLKEILDLKDRNETLIHAEFGRRASAATSLLHTLFAKPIITVEEAKKSTGLSYKATNNLISTMIHKHIPREITGHSRNRIYSCLTLISPLLKNKS